MVIGVAAVVSAFTVLGVIHIMRRDAIEKIKEVVNEKVRKLQK